MARPYWPVVAPPRVVVPAVLIVLLSGVYAIPTASAHDTVEAQELELFVIEDEGTDVIDTYGGYDIVAIFLGGSHRSDLGAGAAGDGFYFRIELYGEPTGPTAALPNTIVVSFAAGNGTVTRTITTSDGQAFDSDFDALDVTTEPLEVHIERAFLLWESIGAAPGTPLTGLTVTTYYGGDARDVAPGGIFVPGTDGAAEYPDPTQIDGRGTLIEGPVPPAPDVYFGPAQASGAARQTPNGATQYSYRIEVPTALRNGAQHIIPGPVDLLGANAWNLTVQSVAAVVEANGTFVLEFTAEPGPGATDLMLELRSDVGGRLPIRLAPDGTLTMRDATTTPEPAQKEAPGFATVLVALALSVALASRRTLKVSRRTD